MIEPQSPGWRRRGWLALIAGVHVLAFLCLKPPARPMAASVAPHEAITYILAPLKRRLPLPKPATPAPERPLQAPLSPVPKPGPAADAASQPPQPQLPPQPPQPQQPQAITLAPLALQPQPEAERQTANEATLPPDPFAPPAKLQDDFKQRLIKGAAAADKQVRKESFTQRDRKLVNDETVLAAAIGKAYVGGGSGMMEEIVSADGTRITRWRMPGGGTACFYAEPNNFSHGRDPFRDSPRISVRSCPK